MQGRIMAITIIAANIAVSIIHPLIYIAPTYCTISEILKIYAKNDVKPYFF